MTPDRRSFLMGAAACGLTSAAPLRAASASTGFPKGFLWGAATAGHQIEGNNVNSDSWLLEHVKPTMFREPSGDAANSFELWSKDLDLVKELNLNSYRFSLEWSRIEPEEGEFSIAMLDHYKRIVEGCRMRGIAPVVTFNHFTTPIWFAKTGGWTNQRAPELFARFCERAARYLGKDMDRAITLNEPNLSQQLQSMVPDYDKMVAGFKPMTAAAARAVGSPVFNFGTFAPSDIAAASLPLMIAAHKAGRAAIKSAHPELAVGVSLAVADEQAAGDTGRRDAVRKEAYGAWLEAARGDDFVAVQNYIRNVWGPSGRMPAPKDAVLNYGGAEVYAPSLAGAVRYTHEACGCPVLVSEHGVGTDDDRIRAELIPAALRHLKTAMDEGVPVLGYMHWSLIDNFEWVSGFGPKFGLCAVDRKTFQRTPKPSARVLSSIARRGAL